MRILTIICDTSRPFGEYKLKMALLGPEESYKSCFRNQLSTGKLSDHNKDIIGVTIGGLKIDTNRISSLDSAHVYVSLWDLDCSHRFSMFRTQYYRGSESILVILDENTVDQAGLYCTEILQHNPSISIGLVVLYEGENSNEIAKELNDPALRQFERINIQQPREVISWALDKFYKKINENLRQDSFGILFLPKTSLLGCNPPEPRYMQYICPVEHIDELNPHRRLNHSVLEHLVTKLGFSVHNMSTVITNKFGEFNVSLREGNIQFTPRRCLRCKQRCQQQEYICIIASSKGFSSKPDITQGELLVVAKILALQDADLPDHVLKQIARLDKCPARSCY